MCEDRSGDKHSIPIGRCCLVTKSWLEVSLALPGGAPSSKETGFLNLSGIASYCFHIGALPLFQAPSCVHSSALRKASRWQRLPTSRMSIAEHMVQRDGTTKGLHVSLNRSWQAQSAERHGGGMVRSTYRVPRVAMETALRRPSALEARARGPSFCGFHSGLPRCMIALQSNRILSQSLFEFARCAASTRAPSGLQLAANVPNQLANQILCAALRRHSC